MICILYFVKPKVVTGIQWFNHFICPSLQAILTFHLLFTTGSIPVVVGAPNIQEFSPGEGAILHIKELDDVASVAKTMKNIASNPDAFNQSLR